MVLTSTISRRTFALWFSAATGSALVGCSSETGDQPRQAVALAPLPAVMLTTERTIVPTHAVAFDERNPLDPADRESLLADGFGEYSYGPGEPVIERTPDGSAAPSPGSARRLVRFVHVTDIHVTDDECPARMEIFDGPHPLDGAARPQAPYAARLLNAAVRTVNKLNETLPIDFVLLGGDSTDSALKNEATWVLNVLSGAESVTCDSGDVNDPVAGSENDPKDPFVAPGLSVPWKFCMGNHDVLIMGVKAINDAAIATATGSDSITGTTDWSQPGGVVVKGEVVPDENRRPLLRQEILELMSADGDGHGLNGRPNPLKANYTMDVPDTPLRFIVYDTALEAGDASGIVRKSDVESFLRPALEAAKAEGKWVVLASHHGLKSISNGSLAGREVREDATLPEDVEAMFLSYPNIILSITGHTHENVVRWVGEPTGTGFWEVQTCSLVEFPNQMRVVEINDEGNGYASIQLVGLDFATDGDAVAEEGRRFAILDHTAGWGAGGTGEPTDRNVKLYVKAPE